MNENSFTESQKSPREEVEFQQRSTSTPELIPHRKLMNTVDPKQQKAQFIESPETVNSGETKSQIYSFQIEDVHILLYSIK